MVFGPLVFCFGVNIGWQNQADNGHWLKSLNFVLNNKTEEFRASKSITNSNFRVHNKFSIKQFHDFFSYQYDSVTVCVQIWLLFNHTWASADSSLPSIEKGSLATQKKDLSLLNGR